jgi:hypothetical protein
MPSTSKKQHDFMNAIAHSPAFAKKVGVPQSVGKEFSNADKGRKFSKGGDTMASKKMAGGGMAASSMGKVKTAAPSKDGVATKGKTKGTQVKMAGGPGANGKPTRMKNGGMC